MTVSEDILKSIAPQWVIYYKHEPFFFQSNPSTNHKARKGMQNVPEEM